MMAVHFNELPHDGYRLYFVFLVSQCLSWIKSAKKDLLFNLRESRVKL
jgi:hypothetical protein